LFPQREGSFHGWSEESDRGLRVVLVVEAPFFWTSFIFHSKYFWIRIRLCLRLDQSPRYEPTKTRPHSFLSSPPHLLFTPLRPLSHTPTTSPQNPFRQPWLRPPPTVCTWATSRGPPPSMSFVASSRSQATSPSWTSPPAARVAPGATASWSMPPPTRRLARSKPLTVRDKP
jgi:hypothetical protein